MKMPKSLSVVLALCFCLLLTTASRAEQAIARLTEHTGTVQVQHQGQEWLPLLDKGELVAGDRVRALAQSSATIERQDGSIIELLPLAEVLIVNDKGFFVRFGQVWSRFMKAVDGHFFLQSPTTTALIRGTVLSLITDGRDTRVVVQEGHVTVQDIGQGLQDVREGEAVNVRQGRLEHLEKATYQEIFAGRRFFERAQRFERMRMERRFEHLQPMQMVPQGRFQGARDRLERLPGHGRVGPNGPTMDQRERMLRERQDWVKELRERRQPPPPGR